MILTCPSCATSYFIADDTVGPNGRKVRCQSCGEVWRATNDEPLELTVAPEPSVIPRAEPEAEPASLAETPAPELPRAFRARAEQQRRLRRAATHGAVWAGLASVFAALIISAFLFRVEVVEIFPRAAAAYANVGAPVNAVGLDFEALSAKDVPSSPGMVVVSGALRNVRDREIVAPPIRVSLLDEHGAEIGFKVVQIDAAPVLPGKVQGFAALIADPGQATADIGVNFLAVAPASKARANQPAPQRQADANGLSVVSRAPVLNADVSRGPAPVPPTEAAPAPGSAAASGLRPATAPGVGGQSVTPPVEAKPIHMVDTGHG
jgi:predicted Zn finger-like uncharacterized protein